jgi:hypothetical protein
MFKIFPANLSPDNKKVPLIKGWAEAATLDQKQHALWKEVFRDRLNLWAIPTGAVNGIFVLDVDVKGSTNGFETLRSLNYTIPHTLRQNTPTGGSHFFFKAQPGVHYGNTVDKEKGIDTRGDGGWVGYYGFTDPTAPIADIPDWLLYEISKPTSANNHTVKGTPVRLAPEIAMGIFTHCLDTLAGAGEGERNHTLNREAFKVAQLVASGSLTQDYAIGELQRVSKEIGLDPDEIRTTIKSAFSGGYAQPLTSPFPNSPPVLKIDIPAVPGTNEERWTPQYMTRANILDRSKLRKPQLFQDWSSEDIQILTGDGGTVKTTLMICEAVHLALGERFLGFDCKHAGKTLYITGEDTAMKLAAIMGEMLNQMGLLEDTSENNKKVDLILGSVTFKKDTDLCLISKDKTGFLVPNKDAIDKIMQAVEDIKPKMVVIDPIAHFWGSEASLNDMNKAVVKGVGMVQERSQAAVVMVNHMGKQSSKDKDMTQFAGRGGTGLPSHARISKVLRSINADEYRDYTAEELGPRQSAMLCNVGKFSDGSPLTHTPFIIIREGFLFTRKPLTPAKQREAEDMIGDKDRVFDFIRDARKSGKYVTKNIAIAYFKQHAQPLSDVRVRRALDLLTFEGVEGALVKVTQSPDEMMKERVYIIVDPEGKELFV